MFASSIRPTLSKKLNRLHKKNPVLHLAATKKILEIALCPNPDRYKNLRGDLKDYNRVHITKSFVLIFRYQESKIVFCDLDHHDNIY